MKRFTAVSDFANALVSMYMPTYPVVLVDALDNVNFSSLQFINWYLNVKSFRAPQKSWVQSRKTVLFILMVALLGGMIFQISLGLLFLYLFLAYKIAGTWQFGLALLVSYPIVWTSIFIVFMIANNLFNIKARGRLIICLILERQVEMLRKRHDFKIIAVAGSVGKTSSKIAIAKLLAAESRVIYQAGNYNDRLTVPLVLFGHKTPSLFDVRAWLRIFAMNQSTVTRAYPYDFAVVELGTDGPGQLKDFSYLRPDLTVVTAVAPEHMENFSDLDAVATEELSIAAFSKQLLVNADDVNEKYLSTLSLYKTYGLGEGSNYSAKYNSKTTLKGALVTVRAPNNSVTTFHTQYLGSHGVKTALCAFAVVDMLNLSTTHTIKAIEKLDAFAGRMKLLEGKHGSIIIDDTYNSSPLAVKAALDVLYATIAVERVAILGSMNELGTTSKAAHEEIGAYCDPKKLHTVVTIGADANSYLAKIAKARGCSVKQFDSPVDAGLWVAKQLKKGTVVLAKGSQNGVYAEEAVKQLLAKPESVNDLVRQSPEWIKVKQKQFNLSK